MTERQQARRLATFQGREDVLNTLSEAEPVARYRLARAGGLFATDLMEEARVLQNTNSRSLALIPEKRVILTLRSLGTERFRRVTLTVLAHHSLLSLQKE